MPANIQREKSSLTPYNTRTEKEIQCISKEISQMAMITHKKGKLKTTSVDKYLLSCRDHSRRSKSREDHKKTEDQQFPTGEINDVPIEREINTWGDYNSRKILSLKIRESIKKTG